MHKGRAIVAGLGLMLGCMPAVGTSEGRGDAARPEPAATPSPTAVPAEAPWQVSVDGQPPQSLAAVHPPPRDTAAAHASLVGWTADDTRVVVCRDLPESDCHECRIVGRDGAAQSLETGSQGAEPITESALNTRVAALGITQPQPSRPSEQPLTLVVETREAEQTNAGDARPMLEVGRAAAPMPPRRGWCRSTRARACGIDQVCAARAHVEARVPSHDGRTVAVVMHISGGQSGDVVRVELLDHARLLAATERSFAR
ncbi:MAG: hypothetical protein K0V04_37655 [Deltaproteobacteria bacterium]|nr:hypothetical protein [Deltaproteobacteria bacterium]